MTRVSATEFKNNIGAFSDAAMNEPVIITSHHRDRLVLMSAEEYSRLTGGGGGVSPEIERLIDQGRASHRSTLDKLAME